MSLRHSCRTKMSVRQLCLLVFYHVRYRDLTRGSAGGKVRRRCLTEALSVEHRWTERPCGLLIKTTAHQGLRHGHTEACGQTPGKQLAIA